MNQAIADELKKLNDSTGERLGKVEVALENNISRILSLEQKGVSTKFLNLPHDTPSTSGIVSGQNWAILTKSDKVSEAKSVTSPLPFDGTGIDAAFNIGRALRTVVTGDHRGSEAEIKALGGGTVPGSFLLPSTVSANYIDNARARSVVTDAGVSVAPSEGAKMAGPEGATAPRLDGAVGVPG